MAKKIVLIAKIKQLVVKADGKYIKIADMKITDSQSEQVVEMVQEEDECKITIEVVQQKLFDGKKAAAGEEE